MTGVAFWPLAETIDNLEEYEFFTAIEFLHDQAAAPVESWIHGYDGCGIHVQDADSTAGQAEYRDRINPLLARYADGYELTESGEVWTAEPFNALPEIELLDDVAVDERVSSAVAKFRRHGADSTDRRAAVRELADVLEYLRSTFGTVLPAGMKIGYSRSPISTRSAITIRARRPTTTRTYGLRGYTTPT